MDIVRETVLKNLIVLFRDKVAFNTFTDLRRKRFVPGGLVLTDQGRIGLHDGGLNGSLTRGPAERHQGDRHFKSGLEHEALDQPDAGRADGAGPKQRRHREDVLSRGQGEQVFHNGPRGSHGYVIGAGGVTNCLDVFPRSLGNKMVVKGEGQKAKVIAVLEQLQGVARVLSAAVGDDGIVYRCSSFDGVYELVQVLPVLHFFLTNLIKGRLLSATVVANPAIIEMDPGEGFRKDASSADFHGKHSSDRIYRIPRMLVFKTKKRTIV
jgi:hypothetical protein